MKSKLDIDITIKGLPVNKEAIEQNNRLPAFYRAIQSVRENSMDITGWLEYFVKGLTVQLAEIRWRGELAIRRDMLTKEHRLSDRQTKTLGHILEHSTPDYPSTRELMP